MLEDVPTGYRVWFRKDGSFMRSGYFDNGRPVGEWTTDDRRGKVYKVTMMQALPAALVRRPVKARIAEQAARRARRR